MSFERISTHVIALLVIHGVWALAGVGVAGSCINEVCPPIWQHWGNSCYALTTQKANWTDANEMCRDMGGRMMAPRSQQENAFVTSIIQNSDGVYWIDCNDIEKEGQWVCGGKPLQMYESWGPKDPNNKGTGGIINADCAVLSNTGKWYDRICSKLWLAVCERHVITRAMGLKLRSLQRLVTSCPMARHVMHGYPVNSVIACAVECFTEPGCFSFNILDQGMKKICQLNQGSRASGDLEEYSNATISPCIMAVYDVI